MAEDECSLIDQIAELPFQEFQFHGFEGKRRVVSFGWRYDFSQHKALQADPVPPFLLDVYRKVQAASGFVLPRLQQVLVTEYGPGAPIGWHKDRPVFNDVMGLSLASSCTFRLRKLIAKGQWERAAINLERRSAYFFTARRGGNGNSIPSGGKTPVFHYLKKSASFPRLRSLTRVPGFGTRIGPVSSEHSGRRARCGTDPAATIIGP
jgi:alkylated DNA repair dioxygenase AlkB